MPASSRLNNSVGSALPPIPAKRYFTIKEVSELCAVKPHALRYWEQEFPQLRPVKRRGNRRYYQHHEVLLVRRIRDLLYNKGFTIHGARTQLGSKNNHYLAADASVVNEAGMAGNMEDAVNPDDDAPGAGMSGRPLQQELLAIAELLR